MGEGRGSGSAGLGGDGLHPGVGRDFETVLCVGGAGSLGTELVRVLLSRTDATIRVLDNNEEKMHLLMERFGWDRVRPAGGDIRDLPRVKRAMEGVDAVYNLAALKHVWYGEYNPMEVLKTNVIGTNNVIEAVLDERTVQVMVFCSSDKAVNPTTFYGQSKAMGEGLTLNAENMKGDRPTAFTVYRPGNFFMSAGNVIEKWLRQLKNGSPVTLTKGDMRRYFIGVGRAAELLYEVSLRAEGGDVWIPRMSEYSMEELAKLFGGEIQEIPATQGEKGREELWSQEEAKRLEDLGDLLRVKQR